MRISQTTDPIDLVTACRCGPKQHAPHREFALALVLEGQAVGGTARAWAPVFVAVELPQRLRDASAAPLRAVSYTHLTLPTKA